MSIYPMMRVPPAVLTSLSAKPLNDDRSADNNSKFSIEDQDESLDKFAVMQAVMNDPLIRFGAISFMFISESTLGVDVKS